MHTKIKICGITNVEDMLLCARLGADAVGLNFYSGSKRFVPPSAVMAIIKALPPYVDPVALYVDEPLFDAVQHVRQFCIGTVQWHCRGIPLPDQGGHPPLLLQWKDHILGLGGCRVIPAFAIVDATNLATVNAYLDGCRQANRLPAGVLLDGHAPGQYGGTGQTAPWQLLADFDPGVPVILAGGLTPENVAEAIRIVRPYAVDVASGVESSPGRKDPDKLKRFVDAVRSV